MFAVVVRIKVKPEYRGEFMEAMLADGRGSTANEPGCLGFNIVTDGEDPELVHLFEVYKDEAAFAEHKKTPHFTAWKNAIGPWLAAEPEIRTGSVVFPEK